MTLLGGVNLALAKFESFSKSLLDVQRRFNNLFETRLKISTTGSLLADENYARNLELVRRQCLESLSTLKASNRATWKKSRSWAYRSVFVCGLLLFLQMSAGVISLLFLVAPFLIVRATRGFSEKMDSEVKGRVDNELARIRTEQELISDVNKVKIVHQIDEVALDD